MYGFCRAECESPVEELIDVFYPASRCAVYA